MVLDSSDFCHTFKSSWLSLSELADTRGGDGGVAKLKRDRGQQKGNVADIDHADSLTCIGSGSMTDRGDL